MTPTAINRTAIYHIALDTANALTGSVSGFRYLSIDRRSPISDLTSLNTLRDRVLKSVLSDDGLIREKTNFENRKIRKKKNRIFYFDPLYILFDDLDENDVVLVLDLTPITNPEWHNPRVCELYDLAFKRTAKSGAKIGAISQNTACALWANFGIPYDQISVIPLYLREGVGRGKDPLDCEQGNDKVLLFVGSLENRKNLIGLFQAFDASGLWEEGYRLKIAGGNGSGSDEIRAYADTVEGVEILGFVTDDQLRGLYRQACAFVYPSYLEGFGLPILEACSWGLPLVTSVTGATAEVAPPGSILVDPYDVASIADGLRTVVKLRGSDKIRLAKESDIHVKKYSFENYIKAINRLIA